jgi:hypothetical protein
MQAILFTDDTASAVINQLWARLSYNNFHWSNSQVHSWFTTVHAVPSLSPYTYIDFPWLLDEMLLKLEQN